MKIALVGYGKMGKTIEKIALERGHEIALVIDQHNASKLQSIGPEQVDVAIEFTQPDAAFANLKQLLARQVPTISGTTGWLEHLPTLRQLCQETQGTFFYASNFSIGVNLFFKLSQQLAGLMAGQSAYTASMEETHHTEKKDAPSGTALTLAQGLMAQMPQLKEWACFEGQPPQNPVPHATLPITSYRQAGVPGTHAVQYQSHEDTIEIKHTAHSRQGFALGAVLVAEWLPGKKGVLTMDEFLNI